jgi:selenide,water dikinase
VVTNAGAQVGDLLILTKPLGTGVVSTAIKRGACPPEVRQAAVESMVTLNAAAAAAMLAVGVSAATDVTGFGLVGHLHELATASGVAAVLDPSAVPLLPGARELCGEGYLPGGSRRNLAAASEYLQVGEEDPLVVQLLCDAQTSGGLLIAVPPERADRLLVALADAAIAGAVVGQTVKGPPGAVALGAGSGGELA